MKELNNKKLLSLTLNELIKIDTEDIIAILDRDLKEINDYNDEFALSLSSSIIKKIFSLKKLSYSYKKFYQIMMSLPMRHDNYIRSSLKRDDLTGLRDLLEVYDKIPDFIDNLFSSNERLFNELILSNKYDIKNIFSRGNINLFDENSYAKLLGYLIKETDKAKVVKALLNSKNNKFIYMFAKMNDIILSGEEDNTNYFDTVTTLLKYNDYRHLLWSYYIKYASSEEREKLTELLSYSFSLIYSNYTKKKMPNIINDIDEVIKKSREDKDLVHIAIFGPIGYEKVKNNTFDFKTDFNEVEDDNSLLNLKISFYKTIYGLTYIEAEQLVSNFNLFMNDFEGIIEEENQLTYETIKAMKNLYDLTLDDKDGIKLYQEVYYKYLKRNGIYCSCEVSAMVIMEKLLHRMYDSMIEIL